MKGLTDIEFSVLSDNILRNGPLTKPDINREQILSTLVNRNLLYITYGCEKGFTGKFWKPTSLGLLAYRIEKIFRK